MWDGDGDGTISYKEFVRAMRMLGVTSVADEAKALFNSFDQDSSGTISYGELEWQLGKQPKKVTE